MLLDNDHAHFVLMLLDNAPTHPDESSLVSSHKLMYLSKISTTNTIPMIQPMDQGVLEALKRRYRKSMLRMLLIEDQEGNPMIDFVKSISIKDAVYMSSAAWDDIPALTLAKSW